MSTSLAPSSDPSTEVRPLRRYGMVLVGVVSAILGTVFGIALTIGTVLVPRQAELSRAANAPKVLPLVSVPNALKAVAPKASWVHQEEPPQINYGYGVNQILSKSFMGTLIVPQAEQQALVDQIFVKIQSDIQAGASASMLNNQTMASSSLPGELNVYRVYDFMLPRGAGSVQMWSIGRGNSLTICLTVVER